MCLGDGDYFLGKLPLTTRSALDEAQMRPMLHNLDDGIQLWSTDGLLLYANPASAGHFGGATPIQIGEHYSLLARICSNESGLQCKPDDFPLARVLSGKIAVVQAVFQVPGSDDRVRWLRFDVSRLRDTASGTISGAVSASIDVTEIVEQGRRLQLQAHFDALTGLPNRVLLSDRMEMALSHSQRSGEMLAVCLLDLDGFKAVNDSLGHSAGDYVLKEVSRRLQDVLRDEDTAARLGGDEFALLIGRLKTSGQCEQILKRILDTVAAPYLIGTEEVRISASIGVTVCPGDTGGAEQLLRHADQSMYKAKETGKNRFCLFDPTLESQARANLGLLRKIEQALERHEFCLYYQPMVDCRKGRVVAVEALIRWQHPVLGLRSPGEFLPLIEHEDIVITLGEWVIAEALCELERLQQAGFDITLCVNVSARQVLRGNFQHRLGELLAAHDPALAHKLEIEILETAALEDINLVSGLISHFRERGVRFALDDFGTGYSSLIHLRRLAADVLKIDQTFVRDMLVDPGDLAIVHGVLGLAMAFQRQVVAEGVETIEHILMLLELGCDVMQGYGIARPLPPDRLLAWLTDFQADPRWRVLPATYPSHNDFEMLLMEVSHRHWLEEIVKGLHVPSAATELPALDSAHCRLGLWLNNAAVIRRYAGKAAFFSIGIVHRDAHRAAQALLACTDEALCPGLHAELDTVHANLLQQLHDFRTSEARLGQAAQ